MKHQTWACALGLAFATAAQAEPCNDGFKSSGNFLSGNKYSTQVTLPGVAAEQAFQRALRFTADNGFTVQSADPKTGQIHAAQSSQLAKGKQVPLDITLRDDAGATVIALQYATGAGQLSPEVAIKEHFCKTVAAAATAGMSEVTRAAAPTAPVAPRGPAVPVIAASPAIPDSEFIRNGQPCMSGLCLGDTIVQLPKSLHWEPSNPLLSPRKHVPAAASSVDRLGQTVKGPRRSLERVATGQQTGAFDADELQALVDLQAVCAPMGLPVVAYFKSASGHPTAVQFAPGLNEAGQLQFRVSQIIRHYPAAISLDQQREVMSAAEQQYRPVLQAKQAASDQRAFDFPTVFIGREGGAHVQLMEAIRPRDVQAQALLKHPLCGGAAPVKLE